MRAIRIAILMVLWGSIAVKAAVWDGTADVSWYTSAAQAYNLTTAEQLAGLAQLVNNGTSDFSGKTITLGADIFLNDTAGAAAGTWASIPRRAWTPIGTRDRSFRGEFDGMAGRKNRIIYGLYTNDSSADYQGLFGHTRRTSIRNVDLLVGQVKGKSYVGALIGKADTGSVTSVHSDVKVTGSSSFVGGLLGWTSGAVTSSSVTGDVQGLNYVGGLVGLTAGFIGGYNSAGSVEGRIDGTESKKSYVIGNVKGTNYVGGVVGKSSHRVLLNKDTTINAISNSYSIGNVKGKNYVGGVVGQDSTYRDSSYSHRSTYILDKRIINVSSQGKVEGDNSAGGVLGSSIRRLKEGISNSSTTRLRVIGSSHTNGDVIGTGNYVGGVVGSTYGAIDSSYHEDGDVSGAAYVGGLAGVSASVSGSYANGGVIGTGVGVGGLVGEATGRIDSSYHEGGDVSGSGSVGGLVGSGSSVRNSHAIGTVIGTSSYVGGLVGRATGRIDSSYHEGGDVSGTDYVGGLAGSSGTIVFSYHEGGDVSGRNRVGGLAGSSITIVSSYHEGGDVSGRTYVGGLVGSATGRVDSSYHVGGDISGLMYVGGVVGGSYFYALLTSDTTVYAISNSYSIGNVKGTDYVGGVVGQDSTYRDSTGKSTKSTYILDKRIVNVSSQGKIEGHSSVGGVLGSSIRRLKEGIRDSSTTRLRVAGSSHTNGDVIGTGSYVGGVVGSTYGTVDSSYHEGGDVSGADYVGGVAGYVKDALRNVHSANNVRGRNTVGGVAGQVMGTTDEAYFTGDSVTGFYQVGGLIGYANKAVDSSYSTANVKGDDIVGGLLGSSYGDVSYSYATGNVNGEDMGTLSSAGHDNLGGLIGYAYSGSISKSFALGNVSGTTKVGGLVGRFDGTSITDSYANGEVTGYYYGDPADQVGNMQIGGLVGYGKGTLNRTYSSGNVVGDESDPFYTGCLVGGSTSDRMTITSSYYDSSVCKSLNATGDEEGFITVNGTPGRTTAAMQTQSTFAGWDFADVWTIRPSTYPFFGFFAHSLANAVVTTASLDGIVYDGTAKTPLVTGVTLFGDALAYGTDYSIAYSNNVNAGMANIAVCGISPYAGCKNVKFEIAAAEIEPVIADIPDTVYTGAAINPRVSISYNGNVLASADYSVSYGENIVPGTGSVTVEMRGNYRGSATKTFVIGKAPSIILTAPVAGDVVLGQRLSESALTGGTANVEGAFAWADSTIVPTVENDGYAVVFVPADTNYAVSESAVVPVNVLDMVYVAVHVGDSTIDSTLLVKGAAYTLPEAPTRAGHDFVGFFVDSTNVGQPGDTYNVFESTIIDAVYQVQTFTIAFVNESGTLQESAFEYGAMPVYSGETPVKQQTDGYTYAFAGWTPDIVGVTEDAVYTAAFDSTLRSYEVRFVNGSEVLQASMVAYGTSPAYVGETPVRAPTATWTYVFKGWDKSIAPVTEAVDYVAQFDSTSMGYSVVFMNGTDILASGRFLYGSFANYTGETPTKAATEDYEYTFAGWSPDLAIVTEDAVYMAVFDSSARIPGTVDIADNLQGVNIIVGNKGLKVIGASAGADILLFDVLGHLVSRAVSNGGEVELAVPSAGVYIVSVGLIRQKVVLH